MNKIIKFFVLLFFIFVGYVYADSVVINGVIDPASTTVAGKVELATDAETVTGTSDAVVTTPGNITARLAAPGTIGGTTPGPGTFSYLKAKGLAAVTVFAGTASRATTNLTFTSAADALLAGYDATNPVLGTTVVLSGESMVILSWTNSTTAVVDTSGTIAGATPTSVQAPIEFCVNSSGTLKSAILPDGNLYIVEGSGIVYNGQSILKQQTSLYNFYVGPLAGNFTATGTANTGFGKWTLLSLSSGVANTAVGYRALIVNGTGSENTAIGNIALTLNTTGSDNTAVGDQALSKAQTAANNTAVGSSALQETTGGSNTGIGHAAGALITSGEMNVGVGYAALYNITTADNNTGIGTYAGEYIADGSTPNQTSANSIYLGMSTKALVDGGTNEIVIGYDATGKGSNTATVGNDSITDTHLKGTVHIASVTANTGGGFTHCLAEATATMSGASTAIPVNIPVGAVVIGVQLRVDTAITSDSATKTWSAVTSGGIPAQALTTGQVFDKNTKVNKMLNTALNSPNVASSVGTITIQAAAGNFTGGVVRAVVYYEDFVALSDNP